MGCYLTTEPKRKNSSTWPPATSSWVLYGKSYSKFHSNSYLRCLGLDETKDVMQEIHDGDYENHTVGRSLTNNTIKQGYYWPKMLSDAKYTKRCPQCQRFDRSSSRPSMDLRPKMDDVKPSTRLWLLSVSSPKLLANLSLTPLSIEVRLGLYNT